MSNFIHDNSNCKSLWASCRMTYDYFTAKNSKADIIKRYQDLLDKEEDSDSPKAKKIKDKIASLQKESEERFMDPKFVSLLEAELLELGTNYNYISESVSEKFARLRSNL